MQKKVGVPIFAKLNSVTRKDAYPLPRIDDTLDTLQYIRSSQWILASGRTNIAQRFIPHMDYMSSRSMTDGSGIDCAVVLFPSIPR